MQQSLPIRALILDMDGVLWKDRESIGHLPSIFTRLKTRDIQVIFATNNATRTPEQYAEKLAGFGVEVDLWRVINSAAATAFRLKRDFPQGGPVYIIGEEGLVKALSSQGFPAVGADANPIAVIAGLDRQITYEKLKRGTQLIRGGLPFYGTNPDRTFPTADGLIPGAGSILSALEAATDVHPIIAGKPSPDMYYMALELLMLPAQETIAVGDRLDTDILGGQRAGCRTGLALSGVSTLTDLQSWEPKPDFVANDLAEMVDRIL